MRIRLVDLLERHRIENLQHGTQEHLRTSHDKNDNSRCLEGFVKEESTPHYEFYAEQQFVDNKYISIIFIEEDNMLSDPDFHILLIVG